jgi:hypothetical protein
VPDARGARKGSPEVVLSLHTWTEVTDQARSLLMNAWSESLGILLPGLRGGAVVRMRIPDRTIYARGIGCMLYSRFEVGDRVVSSLEWDGTPRDRIADLARGSGVHEAVQADKASCA